MAAFSAMIASSRAAFAFLVWASNAIMLFSRSSFFLASSELFASNSELDFFYVVISNSQVGNCFLELFVGSVKFHYRGFEFSVCVSECTSLHLEFGIGHF